MTARPLRSAVCAAAMVALLGAGCGGGGGRPDVAAVVEGTEIASSDTEAIVDAYLERQQSQAPQEAEIPRDEVAKWVLEYQIKLAVVEHLANSLKISSEPDSYYGNAAELIQEDNYRKIGQRQEDFARELQAGQLSQAMARHLYPDISVPESALQAEFERRAPLLDRAWKADAQIARFASEESAAQVRPRVEQGTDFTDAAKGLGAGDVATTEINPVVAPLPAAVLDTIGQMGDGAVSDPVAAGGGWFVVRLERRTAVPRLTLDDVRAEITEFLAEQERQQRFQEWFDKKYAKASVKVDSYYGDWDPESTLVE